MITNAEVIPRSPCDCQGHRLIHAVSPHDGDKDTLKLLAARHRQKGLQKLTSTHLTFLWLEDILSRKAIAPANMVALATLTVELSWTRPDA
jgi:hypothetical protein